MLEIAALGLAFIAWFSGVLYGGFDGVDTTQELVASAFLVLLGIIPLTLATFLIRKKINSKYVTFLNMLVSAVLFGYAVVILLSVAKLGPWT